MASLSLNHLLHFFTAILSASFPVIFTATVIEDLNNLQPPPDFNSTITNNCLNNPSLRYCNSTPLNLLEIFKFTIVASHLCNASNNPNCAESFPKIDLHGQPKIAPLYLSFTFFWKYCPLSILSIDLSNNSLKGNFPTDVLYCSQIHALDLNHNNLSGDFPVQKFSFLQNLTFLNLSYNDFSECKISESHFFEHFNSSSFIHSGILPDHREFRIKAVIFFVGFPAFVTAMVVFWGWFCFCRADFYHFSPSILYEATDGFSKRNLVGKTGRDSVYRGVLRDGSDVRIEVYLDKMFRENRRQFLEEFKVLVQLQHKNIVPVLGWCNSRRCKAIVTEWIEGENIETWLTTCVPPWKHRVKVISGIGAGICYLHKEWPQVNYNLKTKNIILTEDGEPLIITRLKLDDHHSSTKKIYWFGMLVLEIVTNRRRADEEFEKETGFVEWLKLNYPENLENVIDRRMKMTVENSSEAAEMIEFGLKCTDLLSRRQPRWDQICGLLSNTSCATTSDHRTSHVGRSRGHKHVHRREH